MDPRTRISPAELFTLLTREFKRRQQSKCPACVVPFPYRVDRREPDAPNWEVAAPVPCGRDCARIIDEVVLEYAELYELAPDEEDED